MPICEHYKIDKAMLSRIISKLKKLELIKYLQAEDKREKIISLSEKGKEIYLKINEVIRKYEKEILADLNTKDREKLLELLDCINNKL